MTLYYYIGIISQASCYLWLKFSAENKYINIKFLIVLIYNAVITLKYLY